MYRFFDTINIQKFYKICQMLSQDGIFFNLTFTANITSCKGKNEIVRTNKLFGGGT